MLLPAGAAALLTLLVILSCTSFTLIIAFLVLRFALWFRIIANTSSYDICGEKRGDTLSATALRRYRAEALSERLRLLSSVFIINSLNSGP